MNKNQKLSPSLMFPEPQAAQKNKKDWAYFNIFLAKQKADLAKKIELQRGH